MATIVHFDISADDPARAMKFYKELFDWKFKEIGTPANYYFITTRDLEGHDSVGGGLAKREKAQQTGITNFVGVQSIDDSLKKVVELGGKVVRPKQALPGWGFLALCKDTEDNTFGLFSSQ